SSASFHGNTSSQYPTFFQYGPTPSYGAGIDADEIGAVQGRHLVQGQVTGLFPNTTYHYRIYSSTVPIPPGGGIAPLPPPGTPYFVYGKDQMFTTLTRLASW